MMIIHHLHFCSAREKLGGDLDELRQDTELKKNLLESGSSLQAELPVVSDMNWDNGIA